MYAITNKVLEPITFVLAYPTVFGIRRRHPHWNGLLDLRAHRLGTHLCGALKHCNSFETRSKYEDARAICYMLHRLFIFHYSEARMTFITCTGTISNRKYPTCSCCAVRGNKGANEMVELLCLVRRRGNAIF